LGYLAEISAIWQPGRRGRCISWRILLQHHHTAARNWLMKHR